MPVLAGVEGECLVPVLAGVEGGVSSACVGWSRGGSV